MNKNVPAVQAAVETLTPTKKLKQETVDPSLPVVSDELAEMLGGVGTGLEHVRAKDVLIPRLTILQGLSPQVKPQHALYDENARVGQIYDVALSQIFKEVHILPLHFVTQWLEWAPRASGKGLVAIYEEQPDPSTYTVNEKGKWMKPNGNQIIETAQFFCLNLSAGGRPCFIPFSSTQLKKSRKWLTYATNEKVVNNGVEVTPPLFYRSYVLSTVPESNNEGDWMGWKITPDVTIADLGNFTGRLRAVKDFREKILKGEVKADLSNVDEDAGDSRQGAQADTGQKM